MVTKIAIANQKGGVAKTTTTVNLAGALADCGHNVLAVDTDPQGYLTRTLRLEDAYNDESPNLADAFKEPTDYRIKDLVRPHSEFDVLPSNVDMFMVQQELIAAGWKPRERLSLLFDQLDDLDYDFVLVDAPPSLGVINDNVLLAAGNMVIPVEAMQSSVHALDILLNQIETLEERYDMRIGQEAVVISNVNYPLDNDQREMIEYFKDTFENWCPVHVVRHRAAIKRSMNVGGSIFGENAEETDMTEMFLALATDLEGIAEVPAHD
jgi:chromosome partitioning protein